ncbi:hypothetical protein Mcup_0898 [Metallosphaera cuprina Ar-4]|uniref:Uncharacterized protein n=1 Tax=Metallosphaera cuprina (strain Ar-4) TaxID=1006006 RepID=F4G2F5_METCR|nr:hypothetical protein Mcup_0898 [Metallosphaera cuprina Ar-4]
MLTGVQENLEPRPSPLNLDVKAYQSFNDPPLKEIYYDVT